MALLASRRLSIACRYTSRVMFVAAHPDDENSGVLPYVSRGLHARTALLTLTRGEGGQNLIGPDLFEALGLIRTGEMMAAGEYYGVQQFFTRAFDFGFSISPTETLEKWGKEAVLERHGEGDSALPTAGHGVGVEWGQVGWAWTPPGSRSTGSRGVSGCWRP